MREPRGAPTIPMRGCPACTAHRQSGQPFCANCGARLPPIYLSSSMLQEHSHAGLLLAARYRLEAPIARGSMGCVWRARDERLFGRICAAKTIVAGHGAAEDYAERRAWFEREAAVLARLKHPSICGLLDIVSHGGSPYLILEWVEGRTLAEELAARGTPGLPEAEVLEWAFALCRALTYLHTRTPPLIFRDLKPQNIMCGPDGQVTLIDFGIACAAQGVVGTAIGTGGYASPEQYQGLADARSDIFALAATLHHLLTGRDPTRHAPFSFPALRTLGLTVGDSVEAALARALSLPAADRFPSVEAFSHALRPRLTPSIDWPAVGCSGPPREQVGSPTPGRYGQLPASRLLALTGPGNGSRHGNIRRLFPLGGGQLVVVGGRGATWSNLWRETVGWAIDFAADCGALSLEQRLLALGDALGICLWQLGTGAPLARLHPCEVGVASLAFSPNGRLLAAGMVDGVIRLWEMERRREVGRFVGHGLRVTGLAWLPDGTALVSSSADDTLRLWHPGQESALWQAHHAGVAALAASPSGRLLASGGADCLVRTWNLDRSAGEQPLLGGHMARVRCVAWSPDGTMLASGSDDATVRTWEPASGQALRCLAGHNWPVTSVAVSPDGALLVSGSNDGAVRLWHYGDVPEMGEGDSAG